MSHVITCVICIDAILVIVNYIFVVITACNVPAFIYIFVVFISKNKEKRNKKNLATLPSAYAKTLGKVALPG